jgi:PadR family transcriptional regulator, regulatory protein PadR
MQPLHGLLDMLVLRTLVLGSLHGYGIAKAIKAASIDELDIEFGSLYPALKRLELKGWISSKWEDTDTGRRAKCYRLTPAGKKKLTQEHAEWHAFASAVARIMGSPAKERP